MHGQILVLKTLPISPTHTDAFRFSWPGEGTAAPPAYHKLMSFLDSLPGCTPCSVDYAEVHINDGDDFSIMRIYPEPLRTAIDTPLSEGTFPGGRMEYRLFTNSNGLSIKKAIQH